MTLRQFYLSPDGRTKRRQFWLWLIVPAIVIGLVLAVLDLALGNTYPDTGFGLLSGLFSLLIIIPTVMVYIKRFHDRNKSGWWILIGLIPIVGPLWILVELGFLRGTLGPNRYGVPPSNAALEFRF